MPALSDRERQLLDSVSPGDIRSIKLGRKNTWAHLAWHTQTLRLGFREIPHDLALQRRWDEIEGGLRNNNKFKTKGALTQAMNQVREFYELSERTLWLTFVGDELWWCFADTQVAGYSTATGRCKKRRLHANVASSALGTTRTPLACPFGDRA